MVLRFYSDAGFAANLAESCYWEAVLLFFLLRRGTMLVLYLDLWFSMLLFVDLYLEKVFFCFLFALRFRRGDVGLFF